MRGMSDMHQALAMARRCRLRGGDCSCKRDCEALQQLRSLRLQKDRELQQIVNAIQRLETPHARVVEGWKLPPKPDGDYHPQAVFDCGEVSLGWHSETEKDDWIDMACPWPFVEPIVYPDDFERIGIGTEQA